FASPVNVSGARIRGHELTLQGGFARHLEVDLNYTHQDPENRSRLAGGHYLGKQLPGRPADELYARLQVFNTLGKLYYEFNQVSGTFLDQVNFEQVPSRDTHTLGAAWHAAERLTVSFEARNLTDNQITDFFGFPLPGRAYFGTVTLKF